MADITELYRTGRPTLLVPLNGIQLFEITNHDSNVRKINVSLNSARFVMLESLRNSQHRYHFDAVLQPNGSIVFAIKDNGHVDEKDYEISLLFEGSFSYSISKDPYVEGKEPELYNLPDLLVNTNPETDSYRKLISQRDYHVDCDFEEYHSDPMEKLLKIEPITKGKYGERVSEKVYKLTEVQRKANLFIDVGIILDQKNGKVIGMRRIRRVNEKELTWSERMARIEKNMKADKSLMELLGYKKPPIEDPKEESVVQSQRSEPRISVAEPKKSVKSEKSSKSETKSNKKTLKSMELQKSEKSKHSEYSRKPEEDVVIQNTPQEKEGKKKKKKKQCVIS
uniref:NPL domain-containing protein n=1 Tax=Caenorhabditis tropicalis TaxID=1561998 RepID=A0A1I7TVH5_9PELO